jgi:putative transposase
MRQSRFTVEEIIRIIAESELPTVSIACMARKYGITEAALYRWRAKYKGLSTSEAKRLKVLEAEIMPQPLPPRSKNGFEDFSAR